MQSRCSREFLESVDRKHRDANDRWNPSKKNNYETDSGDENPRPIRLEHRCGFLFQNESQKTEQRAGDRERNQNDPEVSAKNRIVQRDLRRHHPLSCSAAVMRFKRTTIVSTQPAMTTRQVQSKMVKVANDCGPKKNVSHAPACNATMRQGFDIIPLNWR